ncbi:MarC family transcriptional regulator [filamentous cyanobacterium CCP5]|nr:MarC family transcriptional regulator [filamentous cyanobacterium CCP5]
MDQSLLQFVITAFVMLIVVVNPVAVAPVFVSVTSGMRRLERKRVLNRALLTAFGVALFFLFAGRVLLSYLGVTTHAFAVSGGVLLFLLALPTLFGQKSTTQSPGGEGQETTDEDVAVFPMALPLLAGPGTLATVLVLATQAGSDMLRLSAIAIMLACVYLISWPILYASDRLITLMGESKVGILTRVFGIILAALAVQYVFNGITGYYDSLINR